MSAREEASAPPPVWCTTFEVLNGISAGVVIGASEEACARIAGEALTDARRAAVNAALHRIAVDVAHSLRAEVADTVGDAALTEALPVGEATDLLAVYEFGNDPADRVVLFHEAGKFPKHSYVTAPGVDQWAPPVKALVLFSGRTAADQGKLWYVLRDPRHNEPGAMLCEEQLQAVQP